MPDPEDPPSLRSAYPDRPPEPATEIALEPATESGAETVRVQDYDDREGYDPAFLGTGAHTVAIPLLAEEEMVEVDGTREGRPYELTYTRFSVVMNKARRLCCITAVNIDGTAPFFHPKRPGWKLDPRIDVAYQVGGSDFYVPTSFDRGHMVRRLDPVWGDQNTALQANNDTHHYTNSCPQVHSFNDVAWGDLEDWILSQEQTRASKASVFTGPIFGKHDPEYAGVQVPLKFYKIVVVVDDGKDRLSATAFVRDQSLSMPTAEESAFDPGRFSVSQVALADLEAETGLDFSVLKHYDVLAAHHPQEAAGAEPLAVELFGPRDAILWAP